MQTSRAVFYGQLVQTPEPNRTEPNYMVIGSNSERDGAL